MTVALVALLWLACGALASGLMNAYWQREYPTGSHSKSEYAITWFMGLAGPIDLASTLIFLAGHGRKRMFHHGWTWRYHHEPRRGDSRADRAPDGVAAATSAPGPGPQFNTGGGAGSVAFWSGQITIAPGTIYPVPPEMPARRPSLVTADVAGPVRAWRMWAEPAKNPPRLYSIGIGQIPWPPGVPMQAQCLRHILNGGHDDAWHQEPAPVAGCTCGIWALKKPPDGGIVGEVALWGRVIEHAIGYRAEYAYPIRLIWHAPAPMPGFPRPTGELRRLEKLADIYGVPLTVEDAP